MKRLWDRYGHVLINCFLLVCLGNYTIERGSDALLDAYYNRKWDIAALAFFVHNVVMLVYIMVRRRHRSIETRVIPQVVAIVAFFSGMAFVPNPTDNLLLHRSGQAVITVAMVLSTVTLFNLGSSFGILVAFRQVRDRGLYRIVRHPMYLVDILWRVGIVLTWPSVLNVVVLVASSGAYVYRALLEERFLASQPEYREYMKSVRYRFVPGVF